MTLLKGGEEIVPGISVKTFRGHTASMQGIIVQSPSGAKPPFSSAANGTAEAVPFPSRSSSGGVLRDRTLITACYISDLMPTTAHIDLTWGMGFDLYPLDTIESKKEYYARALPEKWLTVFTHDPDVPWARVEKDELGKLVAQKVE
jgi:hypothetical protein